MPHAPSWPRYGDSSAVNYVFNVSGETLDIHVEPDTYREEGINIWKSHVLEAYYNEDKPHAG